MKKRMKAALSKIVSLGMIGVLAVSIFPIHTIAAQKETIQEEEISQEHETSQEEVIYEEPDDKDKESEVVISDVDIVLQGNPRYVSSEDGSDRHFEICVSAGAQIKYTGDIPKVQESEDEEIVSSYDTELTMTTPSGVEQCLNTGVIYVKETDKEIAHSLASDVIKLTESGEYQWQISISRQGEKVAGKTISRKITIPDKISAEITLNPIKTEPCEKDMDGELCCGFIVPYTASVDIRLNGLESDVPADARKKEIAYCLSQYELSILEGTENAVKIINRKQLNTDSLIDALTNSGGASQSYILQGKEKIDSTGRFSFQAKLNDTVSEKKLVDIPKLEQEMEYVPDVVKDYYEYDESIIFSLAKGIVAGETACYESDAQGNKIASHHLEINAKGQNTYEVKGIRYADDKEPLYIAFQHKGNGFYKEALQVYPINIKKVALNGSFTIRELEKNFIFFKTRKLYADITFSANNHDELLRKDYQSIAFRLKANLKSDHTKPVDMKAGKVSKSINDGKVTFTYEMDDDFAKRLKSDGIYTIEADADYSALTDTIYYEDLHMEFENLQVKPGNLTIRVQDKLEVEYNRRTDNQLVFEVDGDNLDQSQIACTIAAEDPSVIEIDNDGKYRTLKGGSTRITITVDDSTEYDLYEKKSVTIPVTVLSPSNTDYTLNGRKPADFVQNPDVVIIGENNTKENWYGKEITLKFGKDNLYDELCYSTNGGKSWTHVNAREFVIRESMPTDYVFYFCDTEANISSCVMNNDKITNGKLETMEGIAVDISNPSWNTALVVDQEPSVHSDDKVNYYATAIELTAYAGDKQGCGQRIDSGSGIHKMYVQYGNSGKWEEVEEIEKNDRYRDTYTITLKDNRNYGIVKLKAVDYLGHESEIAQYGKKVCVDSQNPVIAAIPVDAAGKKTNYNGKWTNMQLQYDIGLQDNREQVSGIYRYEYTFIPRGKAADFGKAVWKEINTRNPMLVFGNGAHMNGTLYVRGESNAGLITVTEDIRDNKQEIRLWQEEPAAPKVYISKKSDPATGWYNKMTGPVSITFEYPDYDKKNYAPAVGIVYTLDTQKDDAAAPTSRTNRFYKGIINENSNEVIEVSDYHNENSLVSLAKDGKIDIDTDSINKLTVYVEDAAGNRSESKTYEIKADYTEPQNIKATVNGEPYDVHPDGKDNGIYKKFSQNTVSVSAEAEYGISKKKNLYMAVTKDRGGKAELSSENAKDSLNMEPCSRGLVYLCAVDGAGNKAEAWTDGIVVDNLAPIGNGQQKISILAKGENSEGFYNKDVDVSLGVEDAPTGDNYAGLKTVTYSLGKDGQNTESNVNVFDSQASALSWDAIQANRSLEKNRITIDAAQNESNHAYIEVTATDYAGNVSTEKQEFRIDITEPQIEILFDNNHSENGYYYRDNRIARIDITELNFSPKQVQIHVYKDGKEDNTMVPAALDWENSEENVHSAYLIFDEDGDYSMEVECTDLAGNKSEKVETDTFTIDKTKPVVEVTYDHNNAWKSNYYNQTRTATIEITEHNFDEKGFETVTIPGAAWGKWNHDGDVHRITILFDEEEHYSYTLNYTDLAGNKMDTFEQEEFCIDKSTPVIQISGVENHSANKGDVIPKVMVTDANYDTEGIQIQLQNSKGEKIEVSHLDEQQDNGCYYTIVNVNGQPDEIYHLTVKATDMAGNESEITYRFSLNRNGSVYDLSRIVALKTRKYVRYCDLQDLQVYEMNVNTIEEFQMIVTRNGEMIQSTEVNRRPGSTTNNNVCYSIKKEGNDEIGYQYEYTIFKESFAQEGIYNILFYSRDQAGNEVNNTLTEKKAEISFIVDNSIPTVIIDGVEPGEIYIEDSKNVNVYVSDNFKLQKAYFYLVDEDGGIVRTYDYMDLMEEEGDIAVLALPGGDKKMTLQYCAIDAAGNEVTTIQEGKNTSGFRITTNAWLRYLHSKTAVILFAFLIMGTMIFIIIFLKKRKEHKNCSKCE